MEKRISKWGIACFVLAIIGFMTAFLGGFGVILDVIAIICGIIACFRRKGKAWPQIAGFIIAAISLIVYFAVLSGLNAVSDALEEATSGNDITVTENSASPNTSPLATADKTYKVGDTISDGALNITIQSIEWFESKNQFDVPSTGNRYLKVVVFAENTSNSEVENVSSWSFSAYADDESVDETFVVSDDKSFSGEIGAGKKLTGSIFFEIPADTKIFEIHYAGNMFSDARIKIIQNLG